MDQHPPFGQWLRRRRKSLDLSQLDLAERANCSPEERLRESGELRAVWLAHARYFLALVESAMPQLLGSEQASWLRRLEHEHDNIRAALGRLSGGGPADVELALRICCNIAPFWDIHGHFYEGRRWLAICLDRAERLMAEAPADTPAISAAVRARAYRAAGNLANVQADAATSRRYQLLSLELYRQIGDRRGEALVCMNLGNAAHAQSDYLAAREWQTQALELFRGLDDAAPTANMLNNLGNTARILGEHEYARALQEESLAMHKQRGDNYGVSMVTYNLGWGELYVGDLRRARSLLEQGLELAKRLDYKAGTAIMLASLGLIAVEERAYGAARSLLEQAQALHQQLGNALGLGYCSWGFGALAQAQRDYAAARKHFQTSLQHYWSIGNQIGAVECIEGLAQVHAALGEAGDAARLLGAAAAWRSNAGAPLSPLEQKQHQRAIAAAREQLGDEEYERACAEGLALSLEAAVASALS